MSLAEKAAQRALKRYARPAMRTVRVPAVPHASPTGVCDWNQTPRKCAGLE